MKSRRIAKLAVVAALLCGALRHADAGIVITTPTTMPASAAVNNALTIGVSDTDLGGFSVTGHATDTATAAFSPTGALSDDSGAGYNSANPASFVWNSSNPPEIPTVEVTAGFHSAPLYVTYDNVVDLACPGGTIRITQITDDLATPTLLNRPPGGPETGTPGHDVLDASGTKTFHIGMTFMTTTGTTYSSGACTGSFDFTIEYTG